MARLPGWIYAITEPKGIIKGADGDWQHEVVVQIVVNRWHPGFWWFLFKRLVPR